ncbi:LANO_0H03070g1_1 [Lachancea nothofagi CBS 11611]|uniref:LANO_0H03070g1_1 n=1 Tax=Lachancea nothofagi CBS 11611 TaxID=1266666 RepID=A0A1G4KL13_9SACH|nr:LANO_0H03070g1_1 [Lachancea nothofagi CBS 11611]
MSLESRYKPFLSSRVEARKFKQFWNNDVPSHLNPHPHPINLGGGLPHEGLFPIESMHLNVLDRPFEYRDYRFRSSKLHVEEHDGSVAPGPGPAATNERELVSQKFADGSMVDIWRYEPENPNNAPIFSGFQYSETRGMPQLVEFCRNFISYVNPPAYPDWDLTFADGTADSLFKIFETLAESGVAVLVEEFTFTPTVFNIEATGATAIPIKVDVCADPQGQGINVEFLTDLLENWSQSKYAHLSKPRLLYTIPTGQNPTGMTLSLHKRKQIYALAEKHDFIIVEDDPYGYLRFPYYDPENPTFNPYEAHQYTIDKYVSEVLAKSFLTIDTSGRVLRCETFSKVFFPGLRLSFIVGNKYLISKILEFAEVSTRAPSGVSQIVVNNVIQKWAPNFETPQKAWLSWVMKVAGQYNHRRNVLFQALNATEAFKQGLFTLIPITSGMFACLEIKFEKFPNIKNCAEGMQALGDKLIEEGVNVVQGINMAVCTKFSLERSYFLRVTFAYASNDKQLREAAKRLGKSVQRLLAEYKSEV